MDTRGIFIGATGQDVGKTTTCLGVMAGLRKQFSSVGFIKPVGQRHVSVNGVPVDKDVVLFKEHFQLEPSYSAMSPILLPRGFTRDYLDGKHCEKELLAKAASAYAHIVQQNEFTVVEGTGHVGVGSIVGLSNARIASLLNLDMIIVVPGGLGSTIDELALNIKMCTHYGVNVRGIIVNKVKPNKRDMILEYLPKALKRWNVPLIGCIPYDVILGHPSMRDFENLFGAKLLSGRNYQFRRFDVTRIGDRSLESFKECFQPRQLTIVPASREDLIMEVLGKGNDGSGLILTGRRGPSEAILKEISTTQIPVLYASTTSYRALEMITSFTAKIGIDDLFKIDEAIRVVEGSIDFDALIG
jgi:phosphate acetyltransferase